MSQLSASHCGSVSRCSGPACIACGGPVQFAAAASVVPAWSRPASPPAMATAAGPTHWLLLRQLYWVGLTLALWSLEVGPGLGLIHWQTVTDSDNLKVQWRSAGTYPAAFVTVGVWRTESCSFLHQFKLVMITPPCAWPGPGPKFFKFRGRPECPSWARQTTH